MAPGKEPCCSLSTTKFLRSALAFIARFAKHAVFFFAKNTYGEPLACTIYGSNPSLLCLVHTSEKYADVRNWMPASISVVNVTVYEFQDTHQ